MIIVAITATATTIIIVIISIIIQRVTIDCHQRARRV
jgi:hypothetical protein